MNTSLSCYILSVAHISGFTAMHKAYPLFVKKKIQRECSVRGYRQLQESGCRHGVHHAYLHAGFSEQPMGDAVHKRNTNINCWMHCLRHYRQNLIANINSVPPPPPSISCCYCNRKGYEILHPGPSNKPKIRFTIKLWTPNGLWLCLHFLGF
jgi:hypothetical protein